MVMLGGGGSNMSVDMIVNAIAQGFDKLIAQVEGVGKAVDKSNQLIVDSSGRVASVTDTTQKAIVDAAAKTKAAKEQEAQAFKQMEDRMTSSAALARQKAAEEAKAYQDLANSMLGVGAGFTAMAAAGGAFLFQATQVAARAQTLGIVTKTLGENVGWTEVEIRNLEKAIASQGITLNSSRQSIARMIQGNVDLAHATKLATVAQNAAVIAQMTGSEALDQLILAISTGQVRMLRTMGIMTDFETGYKSMAKTLGKTTEQLTELEKAESRVQSVLKAGENIQGAYTAAMETAGKQVSSLQRHIEESQRMLGEMWLPLYAKVVATITESLKVWENLSKEQKDGISAALGYAVAISALEGATFLTIGTVMKAVKAFQALRAAMIAGTSTAPLTASIAAIVAVVGLAAISVYELNQAIKDSLGYYKEQETQLLKTANSYREYADAAREAAIAAAEQVPGGQRVVTEGGGTTRVVAGAGRGPTTAMAEYKVRTEAEYELARSVEAETRVEQIRASRMAGWVISEKKHSDAILENTELVKEQGKAVSINSMEIKRNIEIMAGAVEAAVSGQLTKTFDDYKENLTDLKKEHGALTVEIEKLGEEGAKKNAGKIKELTDKLKENEEAQRTLAEATAEATRQYVFQQISAGLDAGALLEVSRALGILNENEYEFNKILLEMNKNYQEGAYGATGTVEAQKKLGEQTDLVTKAYERMLELNIPVSANGIALMMQQIAEEEAKTAQNADLIPEAMANAAEVAEEKASQIDSSLGDVEQAAEDAKKAVDNLQTGINNLHDKSVTITAKINVIGKLPTGEDIYKNCFVAGTPINTSSGMKPIESIRVGEGVYAYDESNNSVVIAPVVARIINTTGSKVYQISTDHGDFMCTAKHRWYTKSGWRVARLLRLDDEILLLDGSFARLVSLPHKMIELHTVYNLTVERVHTYFVGGHLVHNAKAQYGLDTVVPPGYPSDTYPIWASTGERVVVIPKRTIAGLTPKTITGGGDGGGGGMSRLPYSNPDMSNESFAMMDNSLTINEFHNYSKAAAAMSLSMVMNSRLRRVADRMG